MPKLTPAKREQRRGERQAARYRREQLEWEDFKRRKDAGLIPPEPLWYQWYSWAWWFVVMGAVPVVGMSFLVWFGLPELIAVAVVGVSGAWLSWVFGPDMSDDSQRVFAAASGLAPAGFYWTSVLGN